MALNLGTLTAHVTADTAEFNQRMKSVRQSMDESIKGFSSLGGIASAVMGSAIVSAAMKAAQSARDFQSQLAGIGILLKGDVVQRLAKFRAGMEGISRHTGIGVEELASGLQEMIGEIGDSGDVLDKLEIAAKAARATNESLADSIGAIISVTKAFGDTSLEAINRVADLTVQSRQSGQAFSELGQWMTRLVPTSQLLNISQSELFGTLNALEDIYGRTRTAATAYQGIMDAMLKPSDAMADVLGRIGAGLASQGKMSPELIADYRAQTAWLERLRQQYSSASQKDAPALEEAIRKQNKVVRDSGGALAPAIIKTIGFGGAVRAVVSAAGSGAKALEDLAGDTVTAGAMARIAGPDYEKLDGAIKAAAGSAGTLQESLDQLQKLDPHKKAAGELKSAWSEFSKSMGESILPPFVAMESALTGILNALTAYQNAKIPSFFQLLKDIFNPPEGRRTVPNNLAGLTLPEGAPFPLPPMAAAGAAVGGGIIPGGAGGDRSLQSDLDKAARDEEAWQKHLTEKAAEAADATSKRQELLDKARQRVEDADKGRLVGAPKSGRLVPEGSIQIGPTATEQAAEQADAARRRQDREDEKRRRLEEETTGPIFPETPAAPRLPEPYFGGIRFNPEDYAFGAFASGGIVDRPTLALLGEGGEREAVIPESQWPGGTAVTVNIGTIQGNVGEDPERFADRIGLAVARRLRTKGVRPRW